MCAVHRIVESPISPSTLSNGMVNAQHVRYFSSSTASPSQPALVQLGRKGGPGSLVWSSQTLTGAEVLSLAQKMDFTSNEFASVVRCPSHSSEPDLSIHAVKWPGQCATCAIFSQLYSQPLAASWRSTWAEWRAGLLVWVLQDADRGRSVVLGSENGLYFERVCPCCALSIA